METSDRHPVANVLLRGPIGMRGRVRARSKLPRKQSGLGVGGLLMIMVWRQLSLGHGLSCQMRFARRVGLPGLSDFSQTM